MAAYVSKAVFDELSKYGKKVDHNLLEVSRYGAARYLVEVCRWRNFLEAWKYAKKGDLSFGKESDQKTVRELVWGNFWKGDTGHVFIILLR